jgi:hypothetical protein
MPNEQDSQSVPPSHLQTIHIQIDARAVKVPPPVTGQDLYRLANAQPDAALYREVDGAAPDQLVANTLDSISLRDQERFHIGEPPQRGYVIVVNARKKNVEQGKLSFMQVVSLAFDPVPDGPYWVFTVSYRNGPSSNPEGSMIDGGFVRIKNGMIFNVTATDRS